MTLKKFNLDDFFPRSSFIHQHGRSHSSVELYSLPPWQRRLCFWYRWFVCLFVCLFVCGQHYTKSYDRIGMKFYGGVLGSTMKN